MILPALTLGIPLGGFLAQVTRDEFDAALRQPFVLSARSRGATLHDVRWRHVLRHAALPGIALSGWGLGSLISGAVVVEVIFSRQGIGQVLVSAVTSQDLPLVVGVTFVVALVYVLANLLTDFAAVSRRPAAALLDRTYLMTTLAPAAEAPVLETSPPAPTARRRRAPRGVGLWLAVGVVALVVLAAVLPGLLATHDPLEINLSESFEAPSRQLTLSAPTSPGATSTAASSTGAGQSLLIGLGATALGLLGALAAGADRRTRRPVGRRCGHPRDRGAVRLPRHPAGAHPHRRVREQRPHPDGRRRDRHHARLRADGASPGARRAPGQAMSRRHVPSGIRRGGSCCARSCPTPSARSPC